MMMTPDHPLGVNCHERLVQLVEDQAAVLDDIGFVVTVVQAHARTVGHLRILEECATMRRLLRKALIYRDAILSQAQTAAAEHSRRGKA